MAQPMRNAPARPASERATRPPPAGAGPGGVLVRNRSVRTVHARTYVLSMHRAPPNGRQPPTLLPIPGHPPGASQRVVGIPAHASPQSPYPPILAPFGASRDGRRRPQRPRARRMPDESGKRPTRLPPKQRGRAYPTLGYPQKGAAPGRHTPGPLGRPVVGWPSPPAPPPRTAHWRARSRTGRCSPIAPDNPARRRGTRRIGP